jgi:hypothetical protein
MIRPLYRSPLLWLGLFGLVFLCWAWAGSYRSGQALLLHCYKDGPGDRAALVEGKMLWVTHEGPWPRLPLIGRKWDYHKQPPNDLIRAETIAYVWCEEEIQNSLIFSATPGIVQTKQIKTVLPFGMIPAAYVVVWAGLLVWRWRRGKRAAAATTPPV